MSTTSYSQLTLNGLWKNNPALVQLLGLCPLLAVTASTVNALGLAAATLFVLVVSNTAVSLIRSVVSDTIRLPVFVMIIAAAVTVTELLMQAYSYELYQILGIFLPLITTNCIILGRADAFARKNPVPAALYDGFIMEWALARCWCCWVRFANCWVQGRCSLTCSSSLARERSIGDGISSTWIIPSWWPFCRRAPFWSPVA